MLNRELWERGNGLTWVKFDGKKGAVGIRLSRALECSMELALSVCLYEASIPYRAVDLNLTASALYRSCAAWQIGSNFWFLRSFHALMHPAWLICRSCKSVAH